MQSSSSITPKIVPKRPRVEYCSRFDAFAAVCPGFAVGCWATSGLDEFGATVAVDVEAGGKPTAEAGGRAGVDADGDAEAALLAGSEGSVEPAIAADVTTRASADGRENAIRSVDPPASITTARRSPRASAPTGKDTTVWPDDTAPATG
jgi:hypothetical protein